MKGEIIWHCPGCGFLLADELRIHARADFLCRCGVYQISDYKIGMPDVVMPDDEARSFNR